MNLLQTSMRIGVQGFLHSDELEQLVSLAENKSVLEVGSFMGLSAWGMAITASHVTCVDTFRANTAGQTQMSHITTFDAFKRATSRFSNITPHICTSERGSEIVAGPFQMIFLDAMHTYDDVKADIVRWWGKLSIGGVFAFHDYGHGDFPGVKMAVDELIGQLPNVVVTLGWAVKHADHLPNNPTIRIPS